MLGFGSCWNSWKRESDDTAAKEATLKINLDEPRVSSMDPSKLKFQNSWNQSHNNKLKIIKPTIEIWDSSVRASRREVVFLTRLRIGHSVLTHVHYYTLEKIIP